MHRRMVGHHRAAGLDGFAYRSPLGRPASTPKV
jgi:hypothetical protein